MVFGHVGDAADRAFNDDRTFVACETQTQFDKEQERIWEATGHKKNLIACSRQFAIARLGVPMFIDVCNAGKSNPSSWDLFITIDGHEAYSGRYKMYTSARYEGGYHTLSEGYYRIEEVVND